MKILDRLNPFRNQGVVKALNESLAVIEFKPDGTILKTRVVSPGSPAANPAFDVTPARLVTGLVTERGVAEASGAGLLALFPERQA